MKKILLLLALFSPSAFALELGDVIPVDRSLIVCQDQAPTPPPRCSYCYRDLPDESALVQIRGEVAGVRNFSSVASNCQTLQRILDRLPNPVPFEVSALSQQKMPGNIVMQYITIQLDGLLQLRGSRQQ